MKNYSKIMLFILSIAMIVVCMTACKKDDSGSGGDSAVLDKSCEDIIKYLYENTQETDTLKRQQQYNAYTQITAENCKNFLGLEGIPFESGMAHESLISPANYSLCIVKVKESDATMVEQTIRDNLSPTKWVCMGGETLVVERINNVILAVIGSKADTALLKETFLKLK